MVAVKSRSRADRSTPSQNGYRMLALAKLAPNPGQARQLWSEEPDADGKTALERLAASIRSEGVLQPLIVTPRNGAFVIVCGERRFKASKLAGLKDVPCVVRPELTDAQMLELSVVENLQREDLTAIDEANAYRNLIEKCGYTQATLAKKLGVSEAAISYKLSLLQLDPEVQKDIKRGELSETQGREIAKATNGLPHSQRAEAQRAIRTKVKEAKRTKPKLDTKDVRTIAKHAVKESKGGPKEDKPKPPTPKERSQAKRFLAVLERMKRLLHPFEKALSEADARTRFADVLYATAANAGDRIKAAAEVLSKVFADLAEAQRRSLARS